VNDPHAIKDPKFSDEFEFEFSEAQVYGLDHPKEEDE
jgi:hypothetical protein